MSHVIITDSIPHMFVDENMDALCIAARKPVYSKDEDEKLLKEDNDKAILASARITTKYAYEDEEDDIHSITDPLDTECVSPLGKHLEHSIADPLTAYRDNEAVRAKHYDEPYEVVRVDCTPNYKVF